MPRLRAGSGAYPAVIYIVSAQSDTFQPVRFNLPVFFAHRSTCPNTHNPAGTITTPISVSVSNSGATSEIGAPASVTCPDPMPISFRHADKEYVAGESFAKGCSQWGRISTG